MQGTRTNLGDSWIDAVSIQRLHGERQCSRLKDGNRVELCAAGKVAQAAVSKQEMGDDNVRRDCARKLLKSHKQFITR